MNAQIKLINNFYKDGELPAGELMIPPCFDDVRETVEKSSNGRDREVIYDRKKLHNLPRKSGDLFTQNNRGGSH